MFWTNFRENSPNISIFSKIFATTFCFATNREKSKYVQAAARIINIFAKKIGENLTSIKYFHIKWFFFTCCWQVMLFCKNVRKSQHSLTLRKFALIFWSFPHIFEGKFPKRENYFREMWNENIRFNPKWDWNNRITASFVLLNYSRKKWALVPKKKCGFLYIFR